MLIEILGPSGVGKSAVLRTALASRVGREWVTGEEARALAFSRPDARAVAQVVDEPQFAPLVEHSVRALGRSGLRPARMINSLGMLRKSCADVLELQELGLDHVIVDDELLLHRASSLFAGSIHARRDAKTYFEMVPAPNLAVILTAPAEEIAERVRQRSHVPNVYRGLSDAELLTVIESALELAEVAGEVLEARGVTVHRIDAGEEATVAAHELVEIIESAPLSWRGETFHERLARVSGSFRKGSGRHQLKNQGLVYCAFSVPGYSVERDEAQRDARRRLERFGISEAEISGRSVLDLGSNSGAMVFQVSNLGPDRALGIEFDPDKVELATAISEATGTKNVEFRVGDIDKLDPEELGRFDVVFALAIERHVQLPERLFELLGAVTTRTLYFEGNAKADMDAITEELRRVGFASFEPLGFCDDDVHPPNNSRPLLVARKPARVEEARSRGSRWRSILRRDDSREV